MTPTKRKELEGKVNAGTITVEEYREIINYLRGKRKEALSKVNKKKGDTQTNDLFQEGE